MIAGMKVAPISANLKEHEGASNAQQLLRASEIYA